MCAADAVKRLLTPEGNSLWIDLHRRNLKYIKPSAHRQGNAAFQERSPASFDMTIA
jgi:hypothetical protein